MNPHDRANLNFLMSADLDTIIKWYTSVSVDDIQYAIELIEQANEELGFNSLMQAGELSLTDEVLDTSEAKTLLSQFTLKGIK